MACRSVQAAQLKQHTFGPLIGLIYPTQLYQRKWWRDCFRVHFIVSFFLTDWLEHCECPLTLPAECMSQNRIWATLLASGEEVNFSRHFLTHHNQIMQIDVMPLLSCLVVRSFCSPSRWCSSSSSSSTAPLQMSVVSLAYIVDRIIPR